MKSRSESYAAAGVDIDAVAVEYAAVHYRYGGHIAEGAGDAEDLVVHSPAMEIAFGEELEKVWDWGDVWVLPTLSENFGLVIAEALERGKRVITTNGAPAWGGGNTYGGRLVYLNGYRDGTSDERISLLKTAIENIAK